MNHFKLRKYPILYIDGVNEDEISKVMGDYLNQDLTEQITRS
jgi:hypothetical protein